jgi:hypothetical protein
LAGLRTVPSGGTLASRGQAFGAGIGPAIHGASGANQQENHKNMLRTHVANVVRSLHSWQTGLRKRRRTCALRVPGGPRQAAPESPREPAR